MSDPADRARADPAPPPRRPALLRPLGVTVVVFLLALFGVAGVKTWRDLAVVERRETELRAEIARTRQEIGSLEHRLERLRDDPATLERLARSELDMVYPDELVVLLPEEAAPEGGAAAAPAPDGASP